MSEGVKISRCWLRLFALTAVCVHAIHDPQFAGIKTRAYHRDPEIGEALDQQHIINGNYGVNERLSPVLSNNNNNNQNNYQPHSHGLSTPQQVQRDDLYNQQQELPLYNRNFNGPYASTPTGDEENAITEYYTGCPAQHTGQLPYAYDCRRFLNCWNGRGHIQLCAPGTLFNAETLECDRPEKVSCSALAMLGGQMPSQLPTNNRLGRLSSASCPAGAVGLQPHPGDCTKFLNCANGQTFIQDCGPGTAFNPQIMTCDFKHKVNCVGRDPAASNPTYNGAASRDSHGRTDSSQVVCPSNAGGLYPHPFDCTKYLNCANGQTYIQDCGPGTAFDSSAKVCDYSQKVGCSGSGEGRSGIKGHAATDTAHRNTNMPTAFGLRCPSGFSGTFAYPFDYTRYISCTNGNTIIHSCADATVFSISKGFCVAKEMVLYTDRVLYIVSEVSYEFAQKLTDCPPKTNGIHLYPFDGSKYVRCADGLLTILDCEPGKAFSLTRRVCVATQQVQFQDRVKFFWENQQLIHGTTSTVIETHTIYCPAGLTGLYPYPFDASKYLNCLSGQLFLETCAMGHAFSLSRKRCYPKVQLAANDRVEFLIEYSTTWSLENNLGFTHTGEHGAYLVCPQGFTGVFLHPFDGTKYLDCRNGKSLIKTCVANDVYSISRKRCTARDKVDAFDRMEDFSGVRHEFSEGFDYNSNSVGSKVACPSGAIGFYPHPFYCSKYLTCGNGQAFVQDCESGKAFDASLKLCVLKERVNCVGRDHFGFHSQVAESGKADTTHIHTTSHTGEPISDIMCPAGVTGLFAYPFDYTRFINCQNGNTAVQNCVAGFVFSITQGFCDPKNKVLYTDRVVYHVSEVSYEYATKVTDCPPKTDGVHLYPFDGSKYVRCANGHMRIIECEPGTAFSLSRRICLSTQQLQVNDRVKFYWEIQQQITSGTSTITQSQFHGTAGSIQCPVGLKGLYPYPFEASKYLSCTSGQLLLEACESGQVFSLSKKYCLPKSQVRANDRVQYLLEYSTTWSLENNLGWTHSGGKDTALVCPQGFIGVFLHPFDGSKYLDCQNGKSLIKNCGANEVYSISRKRCTARDEVETFDHTEDFSGVRHEFSEKFDYNSNSVGSNVACPSGTIGLLPHPFDCSKFLNCGNGQTFIQDCGPGTAFDTAMEVCVMKERVNCAGREYYGPHNVAAGHDSSGTTHVYTTSHTGEPISDIMCPAGVTGLFAYPFDYTRFINCQNGNTAIQNCVAGFVFSITQGFCDPKNKVLYTDRVVYLVSEVSYEYATKVTDCPPKTDGVHLYPFDGSKYVRCANGHMRIIECEPGTAFSLSRRICLSTQQLQVNDRVKFYWEIQQQITSGTSTVTQSQFHGTAGSIQCPVGLKGLYPYPFEASKYLSCTSGQLLLEACESGQVFSLSKKYCLPKSQVRANDRVQYLLEYSTTWSLENNLGWTHSGGKDTALVCPQGFIGVFLHPFDGTKYLDCQNGKSLIKNCGANEVYSISRKRCTARDQVEAYDHIEDFSGVQREFSEEFDYNRNSIGSNVACPSGSVGLLPHPFDCSKFLNCGNRPTFIQECGPGTAFDTAMQVCVMKERVNCTGREYYGSNNVAAGHDSWGSTHVYTTSHTGEPISDIMCPAGVTGLFAYPFDYTRFINCQNGNTAIENCVPGFVFSITQGFCDPKNKVAYTDSVLYLVSEVSHEYATKVTDCPPKTDGVHLYPFDGSKYVRCANGLMSIVKCEPGTAFSLSQRICLPSQQLQVNDRVKFYWEIQQQITSGTSTITQSQFHGTAGSIECPVGLKGLYPYPFEASKYLSCTSGQLMLEACESGQVFSLSKKYCLPKSQVRANDRVQYLLEYSTTWSLENNLGWTHSVGKDTALVCPQGFIGVFLHPFDGTRYLECQNGKSLIKNCGANEVYSISRKRCTARDQVEAYDHMEDYSGHEFAEKFDSNRNSVGSNVACPSGTIGLLPHPFDCSKFLNCGNGQTFIQECGPGTAFDTSMQVCVMKERVNCAGREYYGPHNVAAGHDSSGTTHVYTTSHTGEPISDIMCPAGVTGLFAYPFDYTRFINCQNGNTAIQNCVAGFVFSITQGFCDPKNKVLYTDRVVYLVSEVSYEYATKVTDCPPKTDGVHLYPFDGSKYVRCANGLMSIVKCESGTAFSLSQRICLPSQQLQVNDRVKFYWEIQQQITSGTSTITQAQFQGTAGSIQCPVGLKGLYPYPFEASKYLSCTSGQLLLEVCESGQVFSLSKKYCLPKSQVRANDRVQYLLEYSTTWSLENNLGWTHSVGKDTALVCPQGFIGVFLHPFDGTRYLECQNGKSLIKNCGANEVYSISRKRCTARDQVEAYDHIEDFSGVQREFSEEFDYNRNSIGSNVACPSGSVGLLPHPFDCSKFLNCGNGQTLIQDCGPGTAFDVAMQVCAMKDRVNCVGREYYGSSNIAAGHDDTTHVHTTSHTGNTIVDIMCPVGVTGSFAYPFDYTRLISCEQGNTAIRECASGTVFSISKGFCDEKDKVIYTDRVIYLVSDVNHLFAQKLSDCPPGTDDIHIYPFDGSKYVQCTDGLMNIVECEPGKAFSLTRRSCLPMQQVLLGDRVQFYWESQKPFTSGGSTLPTSETPHNNVNILQCPAGITGFYPYPFEPTKYLSCVSGQLLLETCAIGHVFSISKRSCFRKEQVGPGDRMQFVTEYTQQWSLEGNFGYTHTGEYGAFLMCPARFTGFFPHPFDGSKYLHCRSGETAVRSCPVSEVYSISQKKCAPRQHVEAYDHIEEFFGGYHENAVKGSQHVQQISTHSTKPATDIMCPADVTGTFVYPFDYTRYLSCQHGNTEILSCAAGTVYSISKGLCDSKDEVLHSDRVLHFVSEVSHEYATKVTDCPPKANGIHLYPFDATKYVRCADGLMTIVECEPGKAFSVSGRTCVPMQQIIVGDRVKFPWEYVYHSHTGTSTTTVTYVHYNADVVNCPGGQTGLFPYPFDASKYLSCQSGQLQLESCASEQVFSLSKKRCDTKSQVSDRDRVQYVREYSTEWSLMGNLGYTQTAEHGAFLVCPLKLSGLFLHPFDCTKYLDCQNGLTLIKTCAANDVFSISRKRCTARDQVEAFDRMEDFSGVQHELSGELDVMANYNNREPKTNQGTYVQSGVDQQSNAWQNVNQQGPYQRGQNQPPGGYPATDSSGSASGYRDRWTNMNMARPTSQTYGQTTTTTTTYTPTWTGSSVDRVSPSENVLYVQGSLAPNRNYIQKTYSTPLEPFKQNTVSLDGAATTTTSTNVYYAQPVGSQEDSHEVFNDFSIKTKNTQQNRQNFSREISHLGGTNPWTPIQHPNHQMLPPYGDTANSRTVTVPATHFMPPPPPVDGGQRAQDPFQPSEPLRTTPITMAGSNLDGELQPPAMDATTPRYNHGSWPSATDNESNLYGALQPPAYTPPTSATTAHSYLSAPTQHTEPLSPTSTQSSNVRVYQIYPPLANDGAPTYAADPHYSPPYAGVAHSHNASWSNTHYGAARKYPYRSIQDVDAPTSTTERQDYKTPHNQPSAGINDALRMLLRPYLNRSGTVSDEAAAKAELHIMKLVASPTATLLPSPDPPTLTATTTATTYTSTPVGESDVELIIAGEQHHLINAAPQTGTTTTTTTEYHSSQRSPNALEPSSWRKHTHGHNRDYHLKHPEMPSPFSEGASTPIGGHRRHHHHEHSPEFHNRHPHLPNPFATREGDKSKATSDDYDIKNPYAESTTPVIGIDLRAGAECQFDCGNDKCIKNFEVCDGVNNCGNRKDESNCAHLGYEVRLAGGESPNVGRIEVKILGKWGYVCDDKFGLRDADVVCRESGFKLGASEVRGNSFYAPSEAQNISYAMDEVDCRGDESHLKDCEFKGWGVNNCGPDEIVGVVCKVPLLKCPNNYWLCSTSKECIPPAFVCDNTPDCADKSDESERVCNSPIEYRLEGGRNVNAGRLEVRYRGEWGTVCDDDFGLKEAQVVCNSLGYYGKPTIEKNIFGPGNGPIWLDQVSCIGNETTIDKCNHWTWGEHNCNHTEDVGIKCTAGPPPRRSANSSRINTDGGQKAIEEGQTMLEDIGLYPGQWERSSKLLHNQRRCGHFAQDLVDEYEHPEERVVNGTVAKRGRHPWQATIRTKGRGGISSHWCGAVLISKKHLLTAAHCLAGYPKGAYFVRMGDHYANIAEASEIDGQIENWYIHEKFRDQSHMNNDIALLVLKHPVRFNDYIQPICLPEKGSQLQANRICTISGWGSIKSGVSTPSNILRAAQLPLLPDETCKQSHVYGQSMTEGMFCAGSMDESVDACDGDSGGPLVCSDDDGETLYGIISWGQHCGYANKPGVYVRVEKYIDWIYEKINFSMQQGHA